MQIIPVAKAEGSSGPEAAPVSSSVPWQQWPGWGQVSIFPTPESPLVPWPVFALGCHLCLSDFSENASASPRLQQTAPTGAQPLPSCPWCGAALGVELPLGWSCPSWGWAGHGQQEEGGAAPGFLGEAAPGVAAG